MAQSVKILEKHSLALRWFHWINFPLISLMIWSGILIYWANQAYIPVPEWTRSLGIPAHLAEGLGWHFFLMWFFVINGILYVGYLIFSGEWRGLVPDRHTLKDALEVVLHDLKIRREPPTVRGKFNGAQRIAYTSVILMGVGAVVTGLAIYKPVQLGFLTGILGGYEAARLEHFILMVAFILFFFVHIFQVIRAGWNNFRAMVAGYEIAPESQEGPPRDAKS